METNLIEVKMRRCGEGLQIPGLRFEPCSGKASGNKSVKSRKTRMASGNNQTRDQPEVANAMGACEIRLSRAPF